MERVNIVNESVCSKLTLDFDGTLQPFLQIYVGQCVYAHSHSHTYTNDSERIDKENCRESSRA